MHSEDKKITLANVVCFYYKAIEYEAKVTVSMQNHFSLKFIKYDLICVCVCVYICTHMILGGEGILLQICIGSYDGCGTSRKLH